MKRVRRQIDSEGDAASSPIASSSSSKMQTRTREILSKLKVLVQCSICRDDIFEPLRTPCDHYFCRSCINSYFESRSKEVNDQTGKKLGIQCPNCKGKITKRGLVPAPQLHDLLITVASTNDAYKGIAGHSVLGSEPVVFSARKRVPEPNDDSESPPKKIKNGVGTSYKSKTTAMEVIEDDEEEGEEEEVTLEKPKSRKRKEGEVSLEKPKSRKRKEAGDVESVKRKLLPKKSESRPERDPFSLESDEDENDGGMKKVVSVNSKTKAQRKKTSTKESSKGDDSDSSTVSKKSRHSKTSEKRTKIPRMVPEKKKRQEENGKEKKRQEGDGKEKKRQEDEVDREKSEEEDPIKPPVSPKVKPKPLRRVSKPREDSLAGPSSAGASSSKASGVSALKWTVPRQDSVTLKGPSCKASISIRTDISPGCGRTKLPLISPLKRKEQPLDIDIDTRPESTLQERVREPTLAERLRETISKVSSSTPILSTAPRPTLRNTMSPVTNGVALSLSDEEGTTMGEEGESTGGKRAVREGERAVREGERAVREGERAVDVTDELVKQVEEKSMDERENLDDDIQPIMDVMRNRNYSRRLSQASSDHQGGSVKRCDQILKRVVKKQIEEKISKGVQTDVQVEVMNGDNDPLFNRLSKLFEALCTQYGVEGNINIEGIGRFEMKLTKGSNSFNSQEKDNSDSHCLSQVISVTKNKHVQTDYVQFRPDIETSVTVVQTDDVQFKKGIETKSSEVQTDQVLVAIPPEVVDIFTPSPVHTSTQTDTKDHVSVGREVGNTKVESGVGSQDVKINHHSSPHQEKNTTTATNDDSGPTNGDMGSDFSQSILDMLEEEDRRKEEELRLLKNADGDVISVAETPPGILKRLSAGNHTSPSIPEQTTMESSRRSLMSAMESSRRSLMSSFAADEEVETILESDPE